MCVLSPQYSVIMYIFVHCGFVLHSQLYCVGRLSGFHRINDSLEGRTTVFTLLLFYYCPVTTFSIIDRLSTMHRKVC